MKVPGPIAHNPIVARNSLQADGVNKSSNPSLQGMEKYKGPLGTIKKALDNMANMFRRIGTSVKQLNEHDNSNGIQLSMAITPQNLAIATNTMRTVKLTSQGIENLGKAINEMKPDDKKTLAASYLEDLKSGGKQLNKLHNRNTEVFKAVITACGMELIDQILANSSLLSKDAVSLVVDTAPGAITSENTTVGDYESKTVNVHSTLNKCFDMFVSGNFSLYHVNATVNTIYQYDSVGSAAASQAEEGDAQANMNGLRGILGEKSCQELKDGIAIFKRFEDLAKPGRMAGTIKDLIDSGNSLENKEFREGANKNLKEVGISLSFNGEPEHDKDVLKSLKSQYPDLGTGEEYLIRLNLAELKELRSFSLSDKGKDLIEARLGSYDGASKSATLAIAKACMEHFSRSV